MACATACPAGRIIGPCGTDHDVRCEVPPTTTTASGKFDTTVYVAFVMSVLAVAALTAMVATRRCRRSSGRYVSTHESTMQEMVDVFPPSPANLARPITTEVFLSHNWGDDELGRSNHDRVVEINDMLTDAGYLTWCDSEQMIGDVMERITEGIDNTQVVLIFVTRRYMQKLQAPMGVRDNCKKEFMYTVRRHGEAKMIPVIMEPDMTDGSMWVGPLVRQLRHRC